MKRKKEKKKKKSQLHLFILDFYVQNLKKKNWHPTIFGNYLSKNYETFFLQLKYQF